jgi:hypothetical protein
MNTLRFVLMLEGCCVLSWAQGASSLTARELFYRDDGAPAAAAAKSAPKKQGSSPKVDPKVTTAGKATEPAGGAVESASARPGLPANQVSVVPAGLHLGVRYNVLQVTDRAAKTSKPVDPDTAFRAGDCVAIELTPNRDGFLYVFNAGSSGAWQALLPSPQMPNQRNFVRRGLTTVIPSEHCFEFDSSPGSEKLLVVITEREEDQKRLSDAIRGSSQEGKPPARASDSATLLAGGRLMRDLEMMRTGQLIGRDIKIAKVGSPKAEGERPHSVYAVRASTSPNERLVIEIALRHD